MLGAAVLGAVLLAAGISAGCSRQQSGLQNLNNIGDLKTHFNRDAGKPRIVLLLSPT